MDKDFIHRILLSAAQEVFSTMLGMQAELCEAAAPLETSPDGQERVVALIGVAGNYIGTGMIGCSPALACKAASTMMMNEYPGVDSEVLDAIGEISNMIFGNVKTALEAQVGPLGLSIPTVVFGRNFTTRSIGTQPWITLPLNIESEGLDLRFCIVANTAMPRPIRHGFKREYALADVQD